MKSKKSETVFCIEFSINVMKGSIRGKLLLACFAAFLCSTVAVQSFAQKKIDAADKRKIGYAIKTALDNHRSLVEFVANPVNTQEIEAGVQNVIREYYLNDNVKVDADYDASTKGTGKGQVTIYEYLTDLHNYFRPKKETDFVEITNEWDGKIYEGDAPWVQVNFRQEFSGKDKNGKSYSTVSKVAEMQLKKAGSEWIAKISSIYFVDKLNAQTRPKEITITGEDKVADVNEPELYDDSYYIARLEQGRIAFTNRKYGRSFFYLKEAEASKAQRDAADRAITDLKNKLRAENGSYEEYLSNDLSKEARYYQQKKDYVTAQKMYQHAFIINNKNLDARANSELLLQYVNNQRSLERLYRNGHYEDAIAGYRRSVDADRDNSTLLLGLARCYVKTGSDSLADYFFSKAIASNAENVQVYKWQADFLKQNHQYEEAERAFISFLNYAEVNDPDLAYINSLRTSVRGIALYNSGRKAEALDSLNKAIKYYEKNAEAYCYLSRYYAEDQRNYKEAEKYVDLAISKDSNYVPAYVQKADLLVKKAALLNMSPDHSSVISNKTEAVKFLTQAISKDRRNNEAYFNRGKLYLDLGGPANLIAATEDFTKASEDTLNNRYRYYAMWYRGKSRYALGGDELRKAQEDFRLSAPNYSATKPYCVDYGFLLLKMGDAQNAIQWFKKANNPEANYGEILSNIKLNQNSINADKEKLERAFMAGGLKRDRVTKDFTDLGLGEMLRQEPLKSLMKKLN